MRNFFKIEANGKVHIAYNNVLSALDHWKNGLKYGDYLAVISGEHRVDKKTEVLSYNDNIANGDLYVTYRVFVSKDEFPYDIEKIGLAPSEGAILSNECSVELPADSYTINITIYLMPNSDGPTFYPSENALVRSLLGMEAKPAYTVYGGNANLPNKPVMCDTSQYTKLAYTAIENGIRVRRGTRNDFTIGNPPYVRFNTSFASLVDSTVEYNATNGGFTSSAVKINSVTANGEPVPFGCYPTIATLHPSGKTHLGVFDEQHKLINDPLYKHVALIHAGSCYTIKESGEVEYKCGYIGTPILCSDGSLVSATTDSLYILREGLNPIEIQLGDKVIFSRDGGYDIFTTFNGTLWIYRYDTELVELHCISLGSNMSIYRYNDFAVVLSDGNTVRMFTADGEMEAYSFLTSHAGDRIEDGCFYGSTYCGNARTGRQIASANTHGRFANVSTGLYYLGEMSNVKVCDFNVDSAAIAEDTVYFLRENKLYSYIIEPNGVFVSVNKDGAVSCEQSAMSTSGSTVIIEIN